MSISINQKKIIEQIIDHFGLDVINEVITDYTDIDSLTCSDVSKILANLKKYIIIGSEYKSKLLPYCDEIYAKFGKKLEQLTILDIEKLCKIYPSINLPYAIKKFNIRPVDYPLEYTNRWEFGYQKSIYCQDDKLYYLKFYDMLVVDYDNTDIDKLKSKLRQFCEKFKTFLLKIYQTINGFHIIVISHSIPYNHQMAIKLMEMLDCDQWYIVFSSKNGYKIRLNPKIRNGIIDPYVSKYVFTIGSGDEDNRCSELLKVYNIFHDNWNELFKPNNTFYDTFIIDIIHKCYNNKPDETILKPKEILEYVSNNGVNAEIIEKTKRSLLHSISKPQHLIESNKDYYIAVDMYTCTYYICFKELMMIDIDLGKSVGDVQDIHKYLESLINPNNNAIKIYKSLHGYHLFLVDQPRIYNDIQNIILMNSLGCDYYYSIYSYLRGYSIRLNRKNYQQDLNKLNDIYSYVGFFGSTNLINQELDRLSNIHFDSIKIYQNISGSKMK